MMTKRETIDLKLGIVMPPIFTCPPHMVSDHR